MVEPRRAVVRPRVISPVTGESLLLEDEVLSLIERNQHGVVWLTGGLGSGKTTALAHLAAVLPPSSGVTLSDEIDQPWPKSEWMSNLPDRLAIQCGAGGTSPKNALAFQLAPWTDDELIEYLLAVHRDRCQSVMRRCGSPDDKQLLWGNPELWRRTLDALAADEGLATVRAGLQRVIQMQTPASEVRALASDWCLAVLSRDAATGASYRIELEKLCDFPSLLRLLAHIPVLLLLAAQRIADELRSERPCGFLKNPLLAALLEETAVLIREDTTALDRLRDILLGGKHLALQPTAASLIHAAGVGWKPERQIILGRRKWLRHQKILTPSLGGAILCGALWPRIDLSQLNLRHSDLSGSDLSEANLYDVEAAAARFRGTNLTGASLGRIRAENACLAEANLSYIRAYQAEFAEVDARGACFEGALLTRSTFRSANLEGAMFTRANLNAACFVDANIARADFSRADLSEAWFKGLALKLADFRQCCFSKARLDGCDLEGMTLPGADFSEAYLAGALLTDTTMPGANFRGANLANTGLAEIDWEQADLRDADLHGASFHMGSSRSGLVDSPIASYGSRTGFYTDDYNEQDFKAPEEIRKANLRGADLRGAKIDGVDFYLVDLRDALYDAHQEQHLRGCGAILETRAV